jgi:hypothetical protein
MRALFFTGTWKYQLVLLFFGDFTMLTLAGPEFLSADLPSIALTDYKR